MFKALYISWQLFFSIVACLFASPILAQITNDGTVNTQVNQNGNVAEITGGETRGRNLFHSFQDFSVPTGNEAFFNNADSISNIFSRVTGGNISNIDGLIRANGSANLFLINPAGIVFGAGARLDIGGSFYGSTANSILFEDGEFSAADLDNPPLLTINAPIGLNFRDEPGDIVNRSSAQNSVGGLVGLEVTNNSTLALIGGNINFEAGGATARGGNIFLGGLSQAGTVSIDENGGLSFPEGVTLADISLSNAADVNVVGTGGGEINIVARNLTLIAGESGSSSIRGGIAADSTSSEAQAGNISIDVMEDISVDNSGITNLVNPGGEGNSGGITVSTSNLNLTNGAGVDATTFGTGDAGAVNITADGDIIIDGESRFPSRITSLVNSGGEGNSGGITVSTNNLNLTNGGLVIASTLGTGDAGAVNITATGDITADGQDSVGFSSRIDSAVVVGAEGNSGGITVSTTNLNLTNGGLVTTLTGASGDANDITIDADGSIFIDGSGDFVRSGISANALNDDGNAGNIFIDTGSLIISNGGAIEATNFDNLGGVNPGTGRPGSLTIRANSIDLTNNARIEAATQFAGEQSGIINLQVTEDITLRDNSFISAQAFGDANGGNLNIDSRFIVAFPSNGSGNDLVAAADSGMGGNINLDVEQLFGLAEGRAIDRNNDAFLLNSTNDLDISGNVDGSLNVISNDLDPLKRTTELPINLVEQSETTQQACAANRESAEKKGLAITGKGGVPPAPELPLDSFNIDNDAINPVSVIPAPIETSQGKIQPARGIEVTEFGVIRLVAYRTNDAGDRLPEIKPNCG